ncbi:MAG: hypothetical protein AAF585_02100, partial [Verrucomicrobiota bacterium]
TTERVTTVINSANGSITGTFFDPVERRTYTLRGIVFQKQNVAPGNYRANGTSGRAIIVPNP